MKIEEFKNDLTKDFNDAVDSLVPNNDSDIENLTDEDDIDTYKNRKADEWISKNPLGLKMHRERAFHWNDFFDGLIPMMFAFVIFFGAGYYMVCRPLMSLFVTDLVHKYNDLPVDELKENAQFMAEYTRIVTNTKGVYLLIGIAILIIYCILSCIFEDIYERYDWLFVNENNSHRWGNETLCARCIMENPNTTVVRAKDKIGKEYYNHDAHKVDFGHHHGYRLKGELFDMLYVEQSAKAPYNCEILFELEPNGYLRMDRDDTPVLHEDEVVAIYIPLTEQRKKELDERYDSYRSNKYDESAAEAEEANNKDLKDDAYFNYLLNVNN